MIATDNCPEVVGLACDVVSALDRIFDSMGAVHTRAGLDHEVPLTFSEVRAARLIPPSGHISMRVLADALGISMPAATHIADRLVKKGIAVRSRPEYDRRLVLVELSQCAKAHKLASFQRRAELIQGVLERLHPAARENVARVMSEIAQATDVRKPAGLPPAGEPSPSTSEIRERY